ncbi:MAG: keto-deoxy-phosphogluconate aldolase, partial [Pseudomonadota bacterium]
MLDLLKTIRVLPVIEIDDADDAVPLAEALIAGGVSVFEFTMRT